jgi:uncharacterized OsmC-like protein
MVAVKQKEAVGRRTRKVDSTCTEGVRIEVTAGKHNIVTDEPAERGGTDTAAAPLQYLTASLAACQTVITAPSTFMARRRLTWLTASKATRTA